MWWDIPILSMALFDQLPEDLSTLERLLASPPAKFLELGIDQLLTGYLLGVGVPLTDGTEEKQEREEPRDTSISSPSRKQT